MISNREFRAVMAKRISIDERMSKSSWTNVEQIMYNQIALRLRTTWQNSFIKGSVRSNCLQKLFKLDYIHM